MKKFYFYFILLVCCVSNAQSQNDARHILNEVNTAFQRVKDYSADVKIKTDIPFINILPVNATVFFKQPDKFHLQTKGIAILPKQGPENLMATLKDTSAYMAIFLMNDVLNGLPVAVINILPNSDTTELVVGKFWIDVVQHRVMRSQLTTKTNGTVNADYFYAADTSYPLPEKLIFTIDTKKFKIPKTLAADINNYDKEKPEKEKNNKGKITLSFSSYVINKGLADSIFREKANK
jgi:outer membrane lipoprotein-sorting protein